MPEIIEDAVESRDPPEIMEVDEVLHAHRENGEAHDDGDRGGDRYR